MDDSRWSAFPTLVLEAPGRLRRHALTERLAGELWKVSLWYELAAPSRVIVTTIARLPQAATSPTEGVLATSIDDAAMEALALAGDVALAGDLGRDALGTLIARAQLLSAWTPTSITVDSAGFDGLSFSSGGFCMIVADIQSSYVAVNTRHVDPADVHLAAGRTLGQIIPSV